MTSSRNSTQPSGGEKANGVPSDATSCAIVPPNIGLHLTGMKHVETFQGQLHAAAIADERQERTFVVTPLRHWPAGVRASARAAP